MSYDAIRLFAPTAGEIRAWRVRVGINGFGRIGRNVFRACLGEAGLEFVAVNDITDAETLAHLLKYDSVHGTLDARRSRTATSALARRTASRSRCSPSAIPASCPGRTSASTSCSSAPASSPTATRPPSTSTAGAKKVIISAPAKGADLTICYGVNHTAYDPAKHHVVSNASCTTNCLAPVAKVLHETLRHQARPHDHDPLLHQRPAHPRPAARGPAPRPRRRAVDDPDHAPAPPRPSALVLPGARRASSTAWRSACRRRTSRSSTSPPSSRRRPPRSDINAAMKEAADGPLKGILALLRRAARLDRLQRHARTRRSSTRR